MRVAFEQLPGVGGLEVRDAEGILHVSGTVEGAIDPLVKTLAAWEVQDLTVEEPDLEESVLRLYGESDSATAATPTASPRTRRERREEER